MFLPVVPLFGLIQRSSPATSLRSSTFLPRLLFLAPMNPLDEKLGRPTSPRFLCTRHVYILHDYVYPSLRVGAYLGAIALPDNPRLLFHDPISPLLFLWSYVQLTVQVVYNITKSKLKTICIVPNYQPCGCLECLEYIFLKDFMVFFLRSTTSFVFSNYRTRTK